MEGIFFSIKLYDIEPVFRSFADSFHFNVNPINGFFISHIGSSKSPTTSRLKTTKQKEQICEYIEIGGGLKNSRLGSVPISQPTTASNEPHQTHKINRVRRLLTPIAGAGRGCRLKVATGYSMCWI